MAVDQDLSLGRQVKLLEQADHGGFAAAGMTYQRDRLARFRLKGDVRQHRPAWVVLKADVATTHPALNGGQRPGRWSNGPRACCVQPTDEPPGAGHGTACRAVLVAKAL